MGEGASPAARAVDRRCLAVTIDEENIYLSFAILTCLFDGNVRDLPVWHLALRPGRVLNAGRT